MKFTASKISLKRPRSRSKSDLWPQIWASIKSRSEKTSERRLHLCQSAFALFGLTTQTFGNCFLRLQSTIMSSSALSANCPGFSISSCRRRSSRRQDQYASNSNKCFKIIWKSRTLGSNLFACPATVQSSSERLSKLSCLIPGLTTSTLASAS